VSINYNYLGFVVGGADNIVVAVVDYNRHSVEEEDLGYNIHCHLADTAVVDFYNPFQI
jgi:hypothetical protein